MKNSFILKMNKHEVWATALILITLIICGTLIWINYNSWTLRLEMDDNTKEAIESIEWDEINQHEDIGVPLVVQNNILEIGNESSSSSQSRSKAKKPSEVKKNE